MIEGVISLMEGGSTHLRDFVVAQGSIGLILVVQFQ